MALKVGSQKFRDAVASFHYRTGDVELGSRQQLGICVDLPVVEVVSVGGEQPVNLAFDDKFVDGTREGGIGGHGSSFHDDLDATFTVVEMPSVPPASGGKPTARSL
jgi:hypothetical protein